MEVLGRTNRLSLLKSRLGWLYLECGGGRRGREDDECAWLTERSRAVGTRVLEVQVRGRARAQARQDGCGRSSVNAWQRDERARATGRVASTAYWVQAVGACA